MVSLRISPKVLLSMLLLLSVAPLFFAPKVNSQQFRTLTSYSTTTIVSSSPIATKIVTTSTFVTSSHISLNPPSSEYCGSVDSVIIQYVDGSNKKLHLRFTSDRSIDFFLFDSLVDEVIWENTSGCDFDKVKNALLKQHAVTSYSFDWPVPEQGNLVLAFLYPSGWAGNAEVSVTYQIIYQKNATTQLTLTETLTHTLTNYKTVEVPFLEASASWLVPVALVAIVVVLLFVTWPRKGRRKN